VAISVVTMAELRLGVLLARTPEVAALRTETLVRVGRTYHALSVDEEVAAAYAALVAEARAQDRRPAPHDGLIAATARRFGIPLFTRDAGFQGLPGVETVLV
jgi:predicted nucleic acid-binding protein